VRGEREEEGTENERIKKCKSRKATSKKKVLDSRMEIE
jgi:hypothetical protein